MSALSKGFSALCLALSFSFFPISIMSRLAGVAAASDASAKRSSSGPLGQIGACCPLPNSVNGHLFQKQARRQSGPVNC